MAGRPMARFDENTLMKGQRRKLDTLRKSVGEDIGERAFAAWYAALPKPIDVKVDHDAALIVDMLWPLIQARTPPIPRGGYLLRSWWAIASFASRQENSCANFISAYAWGELYVRDLA